MTEWEAYDVKARKKVKMLEPKIVQLKNKRWAVVGKSPVTGIKVVRILSKEEAVRGKKQ
jgi:5,10-methylene-tetrahydrofolate dehydrogenase/methenyl tetrahydrofolate cyclohydrolase